MANLKNVVTCTHEQYVSLKAGNTVNDHSYNPTYVYIVAPADLKTLNNENLYKSYKNASVTKSTDLTVGQKYRLIVPAGSSFPTSGFIKYSSYENLITSIPLTTRSGGSTSNGSRFGISSQSGDTTFYGFVLPDGKSAYQLNNASYDFQVDIVLSDKNSVSTLLLPFIHPYEDNITLQSGTKLYLHSIDLGQYLIRLVTTYSTAIYNSGGDWVFPSSTANSNNHFLGGTFYDRAAFGRPVTIMGLDGAYDVVGILYNYDEAWEYFQLPNQSFTDTVTEI